MRDIVLVTADSVRLDFFDQMGALSELPVHHGVTVGNYTRSSLSALHSGSYRGAVETRPSSPTLAEVLSGAGYTCLGFSPNPHTHEQFGFDAGFDEYDAYIDPNSRGSSLRQYLSQFRTLQRVYYRLFPPQAKNDDRPHDEEVVTDAVEAFNEAESPRFLWVHLMESHRPYGRGEEGISTSLDRKSVFKPEQLTETEQSEIEEKYTRSLRRVGDRVAQLRERLDGDHTFVFTADHGESFGEAGFYFHPGQRRCVHDVLIDVPVAVDGLSFESDHVSLLDIAPTLTSSVGIEPPDEWNGFDVRTYDRDSAITVAPWHSKATVCWQDFERKLVAADADVSFETSRGTGHTSREEVPPELEQRLNDLGYVDAG